MAGFFLYCLMLAEIFTFPGIRSSESRILTEPLQFQAMAPDIIMGHGEALLGPNPGLAPTNGGMSTTGGAPGITHKVVHHSVDGTEAGRGVILVGFATALVVAATFGLRESAIEKIRVLSSHV